jgi:hypothetical protein
VVYGRVAAPRPLLGHVHSRSHASLLGWRRSPSPRRSPGQGSRRRASDDGLRPSRTTLPRPGLDHPPLVGASAFLRNGLQHVPASNHAQEGQAQSHSVVGRNASDGNSTPCRQRNLSGLTTLDQEMEGPRWPAASTDAGSSGRAILPASAAEASREGCLRTRPRRRSPVLELELAARVQLRTITGAILAGIPSSGYTDRGRIPSKHKVGGSNPSRGATPKLSPTYLIEKHDNQLTRKKEQERLKFP